LRTTDIFRAWGRILSGDTPSLSIEITRECPLRCPGCYAYNPDHLGNGLTLRQVRDLRGEALVDGVLALARKHKPLHLSIVGGDPLVRLFELEELLPRLTEMGIHCQVVTSAFRAIPEHWQENPRVSVVVSIDGLQPDHDARRHPATYDRILRNIAGRAVTVHCTVTRQMAARAGYLGEFLEFWTPKPEIKRVWMSLYTPQKGEESAERLTRSDREAVVRQLLDLVDKYPKLETPKGLLEAYLDPPASPEQCTFAATTRTISADLTTKIGPCQFGGNPECTECGCVASAALHAISRHKLPGGLRIETVYSASTRIGAAAARLRRG
jgi:MoaA/NifB/PqqE/SkfB family radical SAM enzyme